MTNSAMPQVQNAARRRRAAAPQRERDRLVGDQVRADHPDQPAPDGPVFRRDHVRDREAVGKSRVFSTAPAATAASGDPPASTTPTAAICDPPAKTSTDSAAGPGDYLRYPGDIPHVFDALEPGTLGVIVMEHVS